MADELEKKKAREAERAKALSPGGPGTGLLARPAHPMMTRPPAQLVTSSKAGGTIIDKSLADTTSPMTARPVSVLHEAGLGLYRCGALATCLRGIQNNS